VGGWLHQLLGCGGGSGELLLLLLLLLSNSSNCLTAVIAFA
jgi:hypothetical protein